MNDKLLISRRAFAGGALVLGLGRKAALTQGFAGLVVSGEGFTPATPGKTADAAIAALERNGSGADFSYALRLDADRPLVLQGDAGYSRKSERGQASYYLSQPYFKVSGRITIDDRPAEVTGLAWMDREWSSQPLASDQTGWDWFSLHLTSGEKLMLYRLRQNDVHNNLFCNWI